MEKRKKGEKERRERAGRRQEEEERRAEHGHYILTDTEDVKVEALVDALVYQLVRETVKPHVTRQTKFTPLLTLAQKHTKIPFSRPRSN